jgi:hypothetical protein
MKPVVNFLLGSILAGVKKYVVNASLSDEQLYVVRCLAMDIVKAAAEGNAKGLKEK